MDFVACRILRCLELYIYNLVFARANLYVRNLACHLFKEKHRCIAASTIALKVQKVPLRAQLPGPSADDMSQVSRFHAPECTSPHRAH